MAPKRNRPQPSPPGFFDELDLTLTQDIELPFDVREDPPHAEDEPLEWKDFETL